MGKDFDIMIFNANLKIISQMNRTNAFNYLNKYYIFIPTELMNFAKGLSNE